MNEKNDAYWYKAFVLKSHKYCLLDGSKEIRATANDIEGIIGAKNYYGWGTIHRLTFKNNTIRIGREVK